MKKRFSYRWIAFLIPFLLGVYGYSLIYGENWLGAIYSSLRLYGLNVDVPETDINIYIQIARWLAIAVTTSVVIMFFKRTIEEIALRKKLQNPNVVIVHGDGSRKDMVATAIGKQAISMGGKSCFEAKQHILAFESDEAAIRYLQDNEKQLLDKQNKAIYFLSYDYEPSDYAQMGLIISNNAVNCAREYWRKYWVRDSSAKKIAIIGFGKYAQRILEQAILVNVVAWSEPVEYHVFGDGGVNFERWHPQLSKLMAINHCSPYKDSIFFHPSIEKTGIASLDTMDRIIISMDSQEMNMIYLNKLLSAGVSSTIHVRGNGQLLRQLQYESEQDNEHSNVEIVAFGSDADMYSCEVIMHGGLLKTAKAAHVSYVREAEAESIRDKKYNSCKDCKKDGKCGECLHVYDTWDDLIPFEKASNIASADHEQVKRYMLNQMGSRGGLEAVKNELCRVEHERWCRFYYLHNWKYGKTTDKSARIHSSLLPFDVLPETEQEKDWWEYSRILREET